MAEEEIPEEVEMQPETVEPLPSESEKDQPVKKTPATKAAPKTKSSPKPKPQAKAKNKVIKTVVKRPATKPPKFTQPQQQPKPPAPFKKPASATEEKDGKPSSKKISGWQLGLVPEEKEKETEEEAGSRSRIQWWSQGRERQGIG